MHPVPKFSSCDKAIMVITGRALCNPLDKMFYVGPKRKVNANMSVKAYIVAARTNIGNFVFFPVQPLSPLSQLCRTSIADASYSANKPLKCVP